MLSMKHIIKNKKFYTKYLNYLNFIIISYTHIVFNFIIFIKFDCE